MIVADFRFYKFLLFPLAWLAWSCGDFFEENSQNQAYIAGVEDLDELLVGECYIKHVGLPYNNQTSFDVRFLSNYYFPWIHLLDDDVTHFAEGYHPMANSFLAPQTMAAYTWQPKPFVDQNLDEYDPADWKNMYKRIAIINSILYELNKRRKNTEDQEMCDRIEGEARFLRAYYYYWLVNIYAYPYSLNSAQTDLGVPLKTSAVIEDQYFERASVQEVYDQIRTDLIRSIQCFSNVSQPERPVFANYSAACILMSRICLYMEDYENAITYADSVIQRGEYSILNMNSVQPGTSFTYETSPETVFTQAGYIMGGIHADVQSAGAWGWIVNAYTTSQDLLDCYSEGDLRRSIFFMNPTDIPDKWRCVKFRETTGRIGDYMLFRYPEVFLNKAEALAVLGKENEAKLTLNILRERRFLAGKMPSIEDEMLKSGENLINFIRTERRRELCYEGHRWFDLRRYAVNSKYPYQKNIRHEVWEWQGGENGYYVNRGYYELKEYEQDKAAYVFPLPAEEIIFNKGILVQNELRPQRDMVVY